ncbi:ATP synthase F1 subcomplex gamma subunit [Isosphaera pallida ATCC 43644]|jgi:F-type H+-transporting ATPase subunit gamma|uniref:ATP synthase gamma chain n=1 Tax=Isosphaera pallida (strain ATCC 43644 / DSM 9630 / IS1B) TaxID=575540 RepID=E8R027_ISOPI|nr:ATP synthase F1 subunit gamma [Isosphaera pallida]ADV61145.1 ATP synthase F1 subcomplex gamma subunit [Isosphaera pallida ATCC 43644]
MAKARAIIKRRKSIQNIRKITRTMELIATARFRKAMDRAQESTLFTRKITELVAELAGTGLEVSHPLLQPRDTVKTVLLLILTSNRGLAGGYNSNVLRLAIQRRLDHLAQGLGVKVLVSGKRGISFCRFRGFQPDATYTQFEDKPQFDEVDELANVILDQYLKGDVDRVEVAYTRFINVSRQQAEIVTLLPMTSLEETNLVGVGKVQTHPEPQPATDSPLRPNFEFLPDPASILEEIVPLSFKTRLFKCFLDAAVSEQIARMIAMKGATENADEMIRSLTRLYNRARQSQITRELAEIIGGAAALE